MFAFEIDISPNSYTIDSVATLLSAHTPLFAGGFGYYEAGARHHVRSSDLPFGQILFTLSGLGELENETSGERCLLRPGTAVFLLSTDEVQGYHTFSEEPWVMKWLRVEGGGLREYYTLFGNAPRVSRLKDPTDFERIMDAIAATMRNPSPTARTGEAMRLAALMDAIAQGIFQETTETASSDSPSMKCLSEIAWQIQVNPARRWSNTELAEQAGMNPYSFIRFFKNKIGYTPYQYILRCRVKKGMDLLLNSEDTLDAIAEACGFCDAPSFVRSFSKVTGVTPAAFRKMGSAYSALNKCGSHIPWL